MTGNLSSSAVEYGGTEELNPAFLSRLDVIQHDYLPMSETDIDYYQQADPKENQLFQVMIASLADKDGNLTLPEMDESLSKIFALSQLAHQTQLVFSGRWNEGSGQELHSASGDSMEQRLEKSVLSTRNMLNVLEEWQKGLNKDLNKALWDGFISSCTNADDQNLILAMAKMHGFFQERDGWNVEIREYGAGFVEERDIYPGEYSYQRPELETYSVKKVVDVLYGSRPERDIYPEDVELAWEEAELDEREPTVEDLEEAEEKLRETEKVIKALEVLYQQCGCPVEPSGGEQGQ